MLLVPIYTTIFNYSTTIATDSELTATDIFLPPLLLLYSYCAGSLVRGNLCDEPGNSTYAARLPVELDRRVPFAGDKGAAPIIIKYCKGRLVQ